MVGPSPNAPSGPKLLEEGWIEEKLAAVPTGEDWLRGGPVKSATGVATPAEDTDPGASPATVAETSEEVLWQRS